MPLNYGGFMAIAKIIDNKSDLDLSVVRHFDNLLKDMYPMAAAQATEQHDELEARNFQVAKETNFPCHIFILHVIKKGLIEIRRVR
jgi:hypothetical protein